MPICNNVFRRGATYYWRKRVPVALRFRLGLFYLIRSLETRSPEEARRRAQVWTARVEALFEMVRQLESLPTVEFRKLAQAYVFARAEGLDRMLGDDPNISPWELDYLTKDVGKMVQGARRQHAMNRTHPHDRRRMVELLQALNIEAREGSDAYRHVARMLLEAEARACEIAHKRLMGEPVDLPPPPDGMPVPESLVDRWSGTARTSGIVVEEVATSSRAEVKAAAKGRFFSEVFAQFQEERTRSRRKKTNDQAGQTAALFIGLLGDRPLDGYEKRDLATFKAKLLRVPAKYGQRPRYRGLSLVEIIDVAVNYPDDKRLSAKTINRHTGVLRTLWDWAVGHGEAGNGEVADGLWMDLDAEDPDERRPMFEAEQLRRLFSSPAFVGCASPSRRSKAGALIIKDARYWIPLIAAYAGVRLEEAAQLNADDVCQEKGIWIFKIRPITTRRLKSTAAQRDIPVHSVLIGLGLLTFVEQKRRTKNAPLFSELSKANKYTQCGPAVGKWFARYLAGIGLKAEQPLLVFHSLRHSFDTFLQRAGAPESQVGYLMGHQKTGVTSRDYLHGFEPKGLHKVIELLDYEIPEHSARRAPRP